MEGGISGGTETEIEHWNKDDCDPEQQNIAIFVMLI